jgi:hypothetical protein
MFVMEKHSSFFQLGHDDKKISTMKTGRSIPAQPVHLLKADQGPML